MLTLALDTSTSVGSVALGSDGEVHAEQRLAVQATRSEAVLPAVHSLLERCGREATDLRAVVVGGGPGSFTGVRIAASLAKGMCHALSLDLYSYSSLAAVAVGVGREGHVCALFDARRGQVYAAGYRVDPARRSLVELFPPRATALPDLLADLPVPQEWCFAGDGVGPGEALIREAGGRLADRDHWAPSASALLWLLASDPEAGRVADPKHWEPQYVRAPAAERARKG